MRRTGLAAIAGTLGVSAHLSAALWSRVTSLESIPAHNPDESHKGLKIARKLRGQTFSVKTINGNWIDPFLVLAQAPLQLAFRPSLCILRLPSVVAGIPSVGLPAGARPGLGGRRLRQPARHRGPSRAEGRRRLPGHVPGAVASRPMKESL